jgi:hypothetical protein
VKKGHGDKLTLSLKRKTLALKKVQKLQNIEGTNKIKTLDQIVQT